MNPIVHEWLSYLSEIELGPDKGDAMQSKGAESDIPAAAQNTDIPTPELLASSRQLCISSHYNGPLFKVCLPKGITSVQRIAG